MPLNILLADDSMTAQNMAKKILSEAGYEVTTVSNGAAALKKIADRTPDLAILDIYMPGYTGLEVCERVKRAAATANMPVLLSVGKLEPYREQDATEVRADGVIVKPFEASELVTIVTNVILRASGATIDAATKPPIAPVAIQAPPAAEPEALPAVEPRGYPAELVNLETQAQLGTHAQDVASAVAYNPATVSNGDYLDAPLPSPVEPDMREGSPSGPAVPIQEHEKEIALAMAAPAAVAASGSTNFDAFRPRMAEASSSMPFMIDELLKADEKAPEEDSARRFSGPALDVSPVEQAREDAEDTEEIEVIEIPPPEPAASIQASQETAPLSPVSVAAQTAASDAGASPEELTAMEVEAFLREHAAGAGPKFDSEQDEEAPAAIAVEPTASSTASTDVVPEAKSPLALAMPAVEVEEDHAPAIAGVYQPVPEAADNPSIAPASTSQEQTAPVVEELAAQPEVEKPSAAADITPEASAEPAFESAPAESPAAMTEASEVQKPEPELASAPSPATESEAEAATTGEDFMFSVPMILEATAAMSLPELPDSGPRAISPSASTFDAPKYAEAARTAALDEAAIAGAVQRVMDRFKPQIVAEIVRELNKCRQ